MRRGSIDPRLRIRFGVLALALGVSCGDRVLGPDGGMGDAPGPIGPGVGGGGRGGNGPGPGTAGSNGGAGQSGGGRGGFGGTAGAGARGGIGGTAGTGGRGGIGGTAGAGGRGGIGGSAGAGGTGGIAGFGGTGGRGGGSGTGGRGGVSGTGGGGMSGRGGASGTGGTSGIGGTSGTTGTGGFGGTSGTTGTGGFGGTSGTTGTGGFAGTGGLAGAGGTAGTGGACLTCRATLLPIAAQDIVYSAARNELYASVYGDVDTYGNRIVVIDPSTSSVVSTIPIGSNPRTLAISDDGLTLWVGLDGPHAFRKIALGSTPPVVGPLVRLPKAVGSTYYDVSAMAPLPGAPQSVAVAMTDGNLGETRVFDDGVPRARGAPNTMAGSLIPGPPGFLFGSGFSNEFIVLRLDASGISNATPSFGLFRNYPSQLVQAGTRVVSNTGEIIDVTTPDAPFRAGQLPFQGPIALRDPQTLLMLMPNTTVFPRRDEVRLFATASLTQTGSVPLPASLGPTDRKYYPRLTYAGGDAVAFIQFDNPYGGASRIAILHDPAFGTPIGGAGGAAGAAGAGGTAGTGGTGGAPDPCPGCTFAAAPAYGLHMAADVGRRLVYVASHATAPSHPSSIVTVDATTAAVTSIVPVGNDPQPLALSDDGSALWVGLAGESRVRRMTPSATPTPGPAYPLPMLLTTGGRSTPVSIVVLPGMPSSIAVGVQGSSYGGQGVFILDDGQPRTNFVQPPEVAAFFLNNGPPGYLFAIGSPYGSLVVFRLSTFGVTYEPHAGLFPGYPTGFTYSAGYGYASTGEVIDLTNPEMPYPAGRFAFSGGCVLAIRSPSRVMMLCPNTVLSAGPILRVLDPATFTTVGSVTLPYALAGMMWIDVAHLGGDAVALLPADAPLQIAHIPLVGAQP